jgi:hypothetical protein
MGIYYLDRIDRIYRIIIFSCRGANRTATRSIKKSCFILSILSKKIPAKLLKIKKSSFFLIFSIAKKSHIMYSVLIE